MLWHDRIGHPGSIMMRRIIEHSNGYPLKNLKILTNDEFSCAAYCQGKLITRPSPMKVNIESPQFLERIHGDICGPIHPISGSFRYFMVLNRRIFKMVSCVPLIISQPGVCKINGTNDMIKSTISRLSH